MDDSELKRQPKVAFVGIGNPFRGDDGVGHRIFELIRKKYPQFGSYLIQDDFSPLLVIFEQYPLCIIFDAIQADAPPGTIVEKDLLNDSLQELEIFSTSSHHLSLAQMLELAREMDVLPEAVHLLGIVGKNFNLGDPMHPAVQAAMDVAIRRCEQLLAVHLA